MGAWLTLPLLIVNMPSIVGTAVSVRPPVLMVRLLSVTAAVPLIVPEPAKFTVPVPRVNVAPVLLVSVPTAAMFNALVAVQVSVPPLLFVNVVVVAVPATLFIL